MADQRPPPRRRTQTKQISLSERYPAAFDQPDAAQSKRYPAAFDQPDAAPVEDPLASDTIDYTGTKLLVTWGKELLQPVSFNSLSIGPFDMVVVIRDGETPMQAYKRAMVHLTAIAAADLEVRLPAFRATLARL